MNLDQETAQQFVNVNHGSASFQKYRDKKWSPLPNGRIRCKQTAMQKKRVRLERTQGRSLNSTQRIYWKQLSLPEFTLQNISWIYQNSNKKRAVCHKKPVTTCQNKCSNVYFKRREYCQIIFISEFKIKVIKHCHASNIYNLQANHKMLCSKAVLWMIFS